MTIYLYVKQHSITGLKYFGKTTKSNPFSYKGSGTYWANHIKKHGREYVKTIHVWGFDNQEMCTDFALTFSKNNDIVESKEWANLREENGLDGGGAKSRTRSAHSAESKMKMSITKKGKTCSAETRAKISAANRGKTRSAESKTKMSIAWQVRNLKHHYGTFPS